MRVPRKRLEQTRSTNGDQSRRRFFVRRKKSHSESFVDSRGFLLWMAEKMQASGGHSVSWCAPKK